MKRLSIGLAVVALVTVAYLGLSAQATTKFSYSKLSLLGQSGSLSNVTLLTPAATGDYQISVYAVFPGGLSVGCAWNQLTASLAWTDDYGSQTASITGGAAGSTPLASPSMMIHATAGNAITLNTSYTQYYTCGTYPSYNLYVMIIGE